MKSKIEVNICIIYIIWIHTKCVIKINPSSQISYYNILLFIQQFIKKCTIISVRVYYNIYIHYTLVLCTQKNINNITPMLLAHIINWLMFVKSSI